MWLGVGCPRSDGRLEKAAPGVELGEAMAWTRNQMKNLRAGVQEVEDLRDQQET